MSRVGKLPLNLPKGVSLEHSQGTVTVKGPKGQLHQAMEDRFVFENTEEGMVIRRPSEAKPDRAKHGLYRALVQNMITGVSEGYSLELELVGIGYRAEAKGNNQLELALGFSHSILFILPPEVQAEVVTAKGQNPRIILKSIDRQLLGQVAAKIRGQRPPEPYKGKGVRRANEFVRRKAGKSGGKGK